MIRFDKAPEVSVGILSSSEIEVDFKGDYFDERNDLQLKGLVKMRCEKGRIVIHADCNSFIYDKEAILRNHGENDCFTVFNVSIGIGFHWEKNEHQVFKGALKIIVTGEELAVINLIPVEDYLISVIS